MAYCPEFKVDWRGFHVPKKRAIFRWEVLILGIHGGVQLTFWSTSGVMPLLKGYSCVTCAPSGKFYYATCAPRGNFYYTTSAPISQWMECELGSESSALPRLESRGWKPNV